MLSSGRANARALIQLISGMMFFGAGLFGVFNHLGSSILGIGAGIYLFVLSWLS